MNKTAYNGNKTYIITVSDLYHNVNEDRPPSFNSNFNALFSKPTINIEQPFALKDKYDISEIEKNNDYVIIYRNANDQFLLNVIKPTPTTRASIYKLTKNETITCEKLGFSHKEFSGELAWKMYKIEYTKNNVKKYKTCIDYPVLKSYNDGHYYGSDTYISVSHWE